MWHAAPGARGVLPPHPAGQRASELCELPVEITVPAGHVFVAGDNRSGTRDSRAFGPVPIASVIGKVEL